MPQEPEELRPLLFSIAYSMLSAVAEAEDIVQESYLRYERALQEGTEIESPKAWLAAVATRLSIDHLRSARVRRETYVGQWLPEPLVGGTPPVVTERLAIGESLSMAFLLILERLSPVERAVFLLREVFDYDYAEIAPVVGKSEDNCRQIFTRARRHIDAGKPRFEPDAERRDELARQFFAACEHGDLNDLVSLLAADATFQGDGGGKVVAALNPIVGRERVARFMRGIFAKGRYLNATLHMVDVNGQPGAITFDAEGRLVNVFALDIVDGAVRTVRSVINPDKLQRVGPPVRPAEETFRTQ